MANSIEQHNVKYTRGEFCITTHLLITIALIFLIVIIYITHLFICFHTTRNAFMITSSASQVIIQNEKSEYVPIGIVYLSMSPDELLCNSVLLRRRWSVAPAHCVMMHLQQDLAPLRSSWRVAYANNYSGYDETRIRRAIPHPDYMMSDFRNNIALLEHTIVVLTEFFNYVFPKYIPMSDSVLDKHSALMSISTTNGLYEDNQDHGAAFVVNTKILGFFTWGDKQSSGVPFVILHIPFFRYWLEGVIDAVRIDEDYYNVI